MRLRLLAGGLAAATMLATPVAADPTEFDRRCTGTVDSLCYNDFCGIIDCIRTDCVVYSGVFGDGNEGICIGKSRPRPSDPPES